ncbi:MAG: cell division protein SepF [Oscillospiraceae bacterium]|nr:cell division protein SepF [Oscillospiraceae bacterium]
MGLMDEIRKLTRSYPDREEDMYDEYDDEPMEEEPAPAPARPTYTTRGAAAVSAAPAMDTGRSAGRVMNINTASSMQVIVVKPERFDQVTEIADRLRDKQSVVLNLESTNKDVARRLVDFLSGCAFALDGNIQKVAISTYLITPYNVEVLGDGEKEMETSPSYL